MSAAVYFRRARRATLAAIGALAISVTSGIGGPVVAGLVDDPAPSPTACVGLIAQVDRLRTSDPALARLYAKPGSAQLGLPRLADAETVKRCGDPEKLLEQLASSVATPTPSSRLLQRSSRRQLPLEPKPPSPRSLGGSSSTSTVPGSSSRTSTSCAMRSPAAISHACSRSVLSSSTRISPR